MSFPFFLALKYLKPKRSVTSLVTVFSILGVLLGVAIMIIVRAVMLGFGDVWHEKILAFKPHVTITASSYATGSRIIQNEDALCQKIAAIPGVTAVSPAIETRVMAEYNQGMLAPIVIGLDPVATNIIPFANSMHAGKFDLEGDSIVVGHNFAETLGLHVNDKLLVYSPLNVINKKEIYFPEELRVTGIFKTGHFQFDSDFLIASLPLARDLVGLDSGGVYSLYVKTKNPRNQREFYETANAIYNTIGHRYKLSTWQEIDVDLFTALAVEKNMMTLLLAFITIVAFFCVTSTLIVITEQKTHEIGLLKALGFSTRQICLTFILYGWIQCVAGIMLGFGVALLVLYNLQNLITFLNNMGVPVFPQSIYGLDALPWRITLADVLFVVVVVQMICIFFCFLFAWLAARRDPINALRKE